MEHCCIIFGNHRAEGAMKGREAMDAMAAGAARRFDQIRAEQTRALYRNCPFGVIAAALVALMLAATLHGPSQLDATRAYRWSALVATCALCHLLLCAFYRRRNPPPSQWRKWHYPFTLIVFMEGLAWCLGTIVFLADGSDLRALVFLLAWSGICGAAIVVFGAFLRTYLLFTYPPMVPHLFFLLNHRYPFSQIVLTLLIVYIIVLPIIVNWFKIQMIEGHRLRFENIDLAEEMRQAKDRADRANIAKSNFLAAASHDLRQPVHALGLFIGALRGRGMDAEARRLVDQIDESVAAMDDLFTSLLDVSKLDAGAISPSIEPVAIGPLIKRLCGDYADEAAQKGIRLRHADCGLTVESDAVLLERILRNLISNAVRYTDRGGVLVGCRRRGDRVDVQICDSGRGIPAELHEQIFQEFFQVANPERDRSKGLGLGLAIVKRLSKLIASPLIFRSEVGKGSAFRLSLRRCEAGTARAEPNVECDRVPVPGGALIAVIDDEPSIQRAMDSLLSSWSYRVVVGPSAEAVMARLHEASPPDLLICDYRLRGGQTGVGEIETLRRQFGRTIPAMLITGDTAPDRIAEAQASAFLLLHKPLSNARLRAAIGNLLRSASTLSAS
jgi:signal transduction histidine kinase/CheY-like chemotaxis protein